MTDRLAEKNMDEDGLVSDYLSKGPLLPANPDDTTCYCGKDRDLSVAEFQCGMCLRYYHEACVSCIQGISCVPFLTNYQLFCKRCSAQESFTKKPASIGQMGLTALANLMQQNPDRKFFSKDKEILPYIDTHWDQLTTAERKMNKTSHSSIAKAMMKDTVIFTSKDDADGNQCFGLVTQDLTKIGPNCESLFRLTLARPVETRTAAAPEPRNRTVGKRKTLGDTNVASLKQKARDVASSTRLTPRCYPQEHPFNKDGYRYHLAEPDTHAPCWAAFDESSEWAGKPIPGFLYRMYVEPKVMLSLHDRAPQLKVGDDRVTVTGEKGYSMIRATHGVKTGSWFFEARVEDLPTETATRIGWAQSLGNLQAPCGYDKFSYAWRSRKGTRFHQSRGKHYSDGYGENDVLGFFIHLPPLDEPSKLTPPSYKEKPLVKFKSHLYYEEKDYVTETEKKLAPAVGSQITFYKNGKSFGVAFEDIFGGQYFPAISCYKGVTASVNFGPKFKYPPKDQKYYRPMSEAADVAFVQQVVGDLLYHTEHEGQKLEDRA